MFLLLFILQYTDKYALICMINTYDSPVKQTSEKYATDRKSKIISSNMSSISLNNNRSLEKLLSTKLPRMFYHDLIRPTYFPSIYKKSYQKCVNH